MLNEIKNKIKIELPEAEVYVFDPYQDGEHLEAIVVDASFDSIPLIKQHQVVMNALKKDFATSLHALKLKTFGFKKWVDEKHGYEHLIKE